MRCRLALHKAQDLPFWRRLQENEHVILVVRARVDSVEYREPATIRYILDVLGAFEATVMIPPGQGAGG